MYRTKPYISLVFLYVLLCYLVIVTSEQSHYNHLLHKTALLHNKEYQDQARDDLNVIFDPHNGESLGHVMSNWPIFLRHGLELVGKQKPNNVLQMTSEELKNIPFGNYNISDKCFFNTLAVIPGLKDTNDWAKRSKYTYLRS